MVQAAQILVGLAQSADPWFVDSQELRLFISLWVSHLQKTEMVKLVDMLLSE